MARLEEVANSGFIKLWGQKSQENNKIDIKIIGINRNMLKIKKLQGVMKLCLYLRWKIER